MFKVQLFLFVVPASFALLSGKETEGLFGLSPQWIFPKIGNANTIWRSLDCCQSLACPENFGSAQFKTCQIQGQFVGGEAFTKMTTLLAGHQAL